MPPAKKPAASGHFLTRHRWRAGCVDRTAASARQHSTASAAPCVVRELDPASSQGKGPTAGPYELRGQIAVVLQDVFLFAGDVLSNIRLGRPEIPEERVVEAARAAYAIRVGVEVLSRDRGIGAILASITCNYRRPLAYPGEVLSAVRVTRVSVGSVTLEYLVADAETGTQRSISRPLPPLVPAVIFTRPSALA